MKKNHDQRPDDHQQNVEQSLRCGLVMPISAIDGLLELHWQEVKSIICESLEGTAFTVELVSHATDIGIIHKRIVQNLYSNDIIICDVSAKNPNVMFELGMRLAFDKPAIIIKDDKTPYTFDTSSIEHLEYPRDLHYSRIQMFKIKLKEKVIATYEASKKPNYTTFLTHFGEFGVAKIEEKQVDQTEYVLQAVAELRNEIRQIRQLPSSNIDNALFFSTELRKNQSVIRDFVEEYLDSISPTERAALLNNDNRTVATMVKDFYKKYPRTIFGKSNLHYEETTARLLTELSIYQSLDGANSA